MKRRRDSPRDPAENTAHQIAAAVATAEALALAGCPIPPELTAEIDTLHKALVAKVANIGAASAADRSTHGVGRPEWPRPELPTRPPRTRDVGARCLDISAVWDNDGRWCMAPSSRQWTLAVRRTASGAMLPLESSASQFPGVGEQARQTLKLLADQMMPDADPALSTREILALRGYEVIWVETQTQ